MKWKWLSLAAAPLGIFAFYWPLMSFRLRERGSLDNLHQLGKAISLYMADHEDQYPVITGEDFAAYNLNGRRVFLATPRANPLAPYLKDPAYAYDPAWSMPYRLRFLQTIPQYDPRDPMAGVRLTYRRARDPRNVLAEIHYAGDLRIRWGSIGMGLPENKPVTGYFYVLREDGSVGQVAAEATRVATYDAKTGKWADPQPNTYHTRWGAAATLYDWTLFPGEPWPQKATYVGTYVPAAPVYE